MTELPPQAAQHFYSATGVTLPVHCLTSNLHITSHINGRRTRGFGSHCYRGTANCFLLTGPFVIVENLSLPLH